MFRKVKNPSVEHSEFAPCSIPVVNYTYDENGDVVAVPVPSSQGINVPQDGERLELRNVARYGESLDDDRFININIMSPMRTADAIADAMREYDAKVEKYGCDYENSK